MKCPMCNTRHGTTVHKRLIQCPKWAPTFRKAWTQSWGTWAEYTEQWYDNASPEDMHHVACLRVPGSFYGGALSAVRAQCNCLGVWPY